MLNVSKAFLKKQLRTNYGVAWNTSNSLNRKVNVLNIRSGASATLAKKHNVNLGLVWQQKTGTNAAAVTYFTGTMGYSYHF